MLVTLPVRRGPGSGDRGPWGFKPWDSGPRDSGPRGSGTAGSQPGVIDAADVRLHQPSPLGLCTAMTEHLWDLIDAENSESDIEGRADDFDAHDLSTVREAMVDNCPEYSGDSSPPEP